MGLREIRLQDVECDGAIGSFASRFGNSVMRNYVFVSIMATIEIGYTQVTVFPEQGMGGPRLSSTRSSPKPLSNSLRRISCLTALNISWFSAFWGLQRPVRRRPSNMNRSWSQWSKKSQWASTRPITKRTAGRSSIALSTLASVKGRMPC